MNETLCPFPARVPYAVLDAYVRETLEQVGVDAPIAGAMADAMLEGDLLGHRTHGLWFLSTYLERISGGHIRGSGEVSVVADEGSAFTWAANRLPGAWVMRLAGDEVLRRLNQHPVVSVAIDDCSHIGALQAYLPRFTDRGLVPLMAVSNPGVASVAPPGGADAVVTTNPIAMGIPTRGEPVLIDQCTSIASNALFEDPAVQERGYRATGWWTGKGSPRRIRQSSGPHLLARSCRWVARTSATRASPWP